MSFETLQKALARSLCLLAFCSSLFGQGLTGQISGSVTDPSGGAVANSAVQLTNMQTSQTRSTNTDAGGRFVFTELLPGNYSISIENPGFKKYEQTGINVTAAERVTLPTIPLQLGAVSETVSVSGQTAAVQTESAERAGLITSREMQEISLKGRS
jgi:hypothetical protein